MKRLGFLFPVLFTLIVTASFAQDVIVTKTGEIKAKVEEIGISEIKYRDFDNLNGPIIVIDKRNVIAIRYPNGKNETIKQDPYDVGAELDVRNKTHAFKFEVFS